MIALPRRRHDRRRAAVGSATRGLGLVVACALLLAACVGGSGSSGFDVLESQALSRVTESGECESFDGLLICPADSGAAPTPTTPPDPTSAPAFTPTASPTESTALPTADATPPQTPAANGTTTPTIAATPTLAATSAATASPTPTATVMASPGIVTGATDSETALDCFAAGDAACGLSFPFTPVGFDAEAAFRVASRRVGTTMAWAIVEPIPAIEGGAPFAYVAPLAVDLSQEAMGSPAMEMLQVVVLAFERDPGPVPAEVDLLSDTGADVAFAVAPFPIALR